MSTFYKSSNNLSLLQIYHTLHVQQIISVILCMWLHVTSQYHYYHFNYPQTTTKNNKTTHGWCNITTSSNPKFYNGYSPLLHTTKNTNRHISVHNSTTITCCYGHTTKTTTTITTTQTSTITSNNNTMITSTSTMTTMTMNTAKTITRTTQLPVLLSLPPLLLPGLYNYQYILLILLLLLLLLLLLQLLPGLYNYQYYTNLLVLLLV